MAFTKLDPTLGITRNAEIARKTIREAGWNDGLSAHDMGVASIIDDACLDIELEFGWGIADYVWVYAYELFDELASYNEGTIVARLNTYAEFADRWEAPASWKVAAHE